MFNAHASLLEVLQTNKEIRMNQKGKIIIVFIFVFTMLVIGTLFADEAAKAKALVEKGVVMAVTKGEEPTLQAIQNVNGPFIDGDLYLFAGPLDRVTMTAHPYKPQIVNTDLSTFNDGHGNFLFFDFAKIAIEDGAGWTEYWWPKPGSDELSHKRTYVMRVPGQDMYIACEYYMD